jgi:predicted nucleic acid-binding protein
MKTPVILDTGPLVGLLDARDEHHDWTVERMKQIASPMITCESVVSEALFVLGRRKNPIHRLMALLEGGQIRITQSLALERERARVFEILPTYNNLSPSLADACLVRMSENHPRRKIFTLDNHFRIYRRNGDEPIPLLIPA